MPYQPKKNDLERVAKRLDEDEADPVHYIELLNDATLKAKGG